ncbi:MAG: hypothetical protein IJH20_04380 [Bacilli bacterium]|nr:hypothetical protein [Bacilli bacterium]
MKNKNELVDTNILESEKKKKLGITLLSVGIGLILFSILLVLVSYVDFNKLLVNLNFSGSIAHLLGLMIAGLLLLVGNGLTISGIVLIVINNKKIKSYTKETIIPKAKETFNKAEPVVTDVIKTVGEGLEDIANNVKETINKNNKKGE